jgi:hypothetical protein
MSTALRTTLSISSEGITWQQQQQQSQGQHQQMFVTPSMSHGASCKQHQDLLSHNQQGRHDFTSQINKTTSLQSHPVHHEPAGGIRHAACATHKSHSQATNNKHITNYRTLRSHSWTLLLAAHIAQHAHKLMTHEAV